MKFFYNICIVGCGGTGGNFAARLSQFLSTSESKAEVILIDGDYVEESNISRQPFVSGELLLNKAVALAAAIDDTYAYEVKAYPHYLNNIEDLGNAWKVFSYSSEYIYVDNEKRKLVNILVGCCDNHRCRQVMEKFFDKNSSLIYLDAANEFSEGEIVIGIRMNNRLLAPSRKFYFPEVMRSRGKRKSEESCGAVNIHHPQHLATNCFAANILLTIIANLITEQKIDGGMVIFDTFQYSCLFRKYKEDEHLGQ